MIDFVNKLAQISVSKEAAPDAETRCDPVLAALGDRVRNLRARRSEGDLKRILVGREPFYSRADMTYPTAGQSSQASFEGLLAALQRELKSLERTRQMKVGTRVAASFAV